MGNKIVVTGGLGFIGSHLVEELKKQKLGEVEIIDVKKDWWNLESYEECEYLLRSKPDVVFDLATLPLPMSLKEPYKVAHDIVKMALNLCELQRLGYFKTLVHVSSSEAYGSAVHTPMDEGHPLNPTTPYASAKASADLILLSYAKTFGLDIVIPRCFNTYGERQPIEYGAIIPKTIHSILTGKAPEIYGKGWQERDFNYVKDIVKGIISAWKCKEAHGQIVNIASGNHLSIQFIVNTIAKLMKYEGKIIYKPSRVSDVTRHYGDNTKAKVLFDYKPEYTIHEGLKRTIKYYVSTLSSDKNIH